MNKKENIEWDTGRGKRVVEAYQKLVAEEVLNTGLTITHA